MVFFPSAFYQHVVDVDLNVPPDLVSKHLIYEPLIRHACVLKVEWHYFVTKKTLAGNNEVFS